MQNSHKVEEDEKVIGSELRVIRARLVGGGHGAIKVMAARLETPYRTYQGWEAKKGAIPGAAAVAVRALLRLQELSDDHSMPIQEHEKASVEAP
jgi:hypothetical protein